MNAFKTVRRTTASREDDLTPLRATLVPEFEEVALLADAMRGTIACPSPRIFGSTPNQLIAARLNENPKASADEIAASVPEVWKGRVLLALIKADELPRRSLRESIAGTLYVQDSSKTVLTFEAANDELVLQKAIEAWAARKGRYRTLRVNRIDGAPAQGSPWAEAFARAGFADDYKGLLKVTS